MANRKRPKPAAAPRPASRPSTSQRQPKDVVLFQLALVLMRGGELTHKRMAEEFLLTRRSSERYMNALRDAGLPIERKKVGRDVQFVIDPRRARLNVEAIDVPPHAARSLSLLIVAAALLPRSLGVREAVDRTVRAALRLRGMKAASELRRLEDAVIVLENDAKDYQGKGDVFAALLDAVIEGRRVKARYRSPQKGASDEVFFAATVGLYKGGLYVLAVPEDGAAPRWLALERFEGVPVVDARAATIKPDVRQRALDDARRRWGPARPRDKQDVITLHFSEAAAPYVLARPWHEQADVESWPKDQGGGVRMSLRLTGRTDMFESWVKSWGAEVKVLRPADMAKRIADELERAAAQHREGAAAFARELEE